MQSAIVYRPVGGLVAHSLIHSVFILSHSCWWSVAMVVVSTAGSRSVASFAISSALSFPSMFMCPGTHDTSIIAYLFSSRKVMAVSTNFCDICRLDPGVSFVIAVTDGVLSANRMILVCLLFVCGISCWNSIAVSNPLNSANISASYTSASLPIPSLPHLLSTPFQYTTHPAPVRHCVPVPSLSLIHRCR